MRTSRLPVLPLLPAGLIAIGITAILLMAWLLWIDTNEFGPVCSSMNCSSFYSWDAQRLSFEIPLLVVGVGLILLGIRSARESSTVVLGGTR
jgi:hypothetical protein